MTNNKLKDDGGPAFSRAAFEAENTFDDGARGMSLRAWVMGQCMAAAFACDTELHFNDGETYDQARARHWRQVAEAAAIAADAVIAELGKS
jgi:hypothetical protein